MFMRLSLVRRFIIVFTAVGCVMFMPCSWAETSFKPNETAVSISNGDHVIPGILAVPKNIADKPMPAVVLLHGTASQKNEVGNLYQRLAAKLAEVGIASLRIDFIGTGDSTMDYRFYSLRSAQGDALAAINYLSEQHRFDKERVGLVGFSQGGLIAQLVAENKTNIKGLVTWSSVAGDGIGAFQPFFDQYYGEAQNNGYAVVHFPWRPEPLNFGLQWFDEIKENKSLSDLGAYKGAILAVAGREDTTVPYESSEKIVAAVGSVDATLILVKGANHLFNVLSDNDKNGLAEDQVHADNLLSLTSAWLKQRL